MASGSQGNLWSKVKLGNVLQLDHSPPFSLSTSFNSHRKKKASVWDSLRADILRLFSSPHNRELQLTYYDIRHHFSHLDQGLHKDTGPISSSSSFSSSSSSLKSFDDSSDRTKWTEIGEYAPFSDMDLNSISNGPYISEMLRPARYFSTKMVYFEEQQSVGRYGMEDKMPQKLHYLYLLHTTSYPSYGQLSNTAWEMQKDAVKAIAKLEREIASKGHSHSWDMSFLSERKLAHSFLRDSLEFYRIADVKLMDYLKEAEWYRKEVTVPHPYMGQGGRPIGRAGEKILLQPKGTLFSFGLTWDNVILSKGTYPKDMIIPISEQKKPIELSESLHITLPGPNYKPELVVERFQRFLDHLSDPKLQESLLGGPFDKALLHQHLIPLYGFTLVLQSENVAWWEKVRKDNHIRADDLVRQVHYLQQMHQLLLETLATSLSHLMSQKVQTIPPPSSKGKSSTTLEDQWMGMLTPWIKKACKAVVPSFRSALSSPTKEACEHLTLLLPTIITSMGQGYKKTRSTWMYWRLRPLVGFLLREGKSKGFLMRLQSLDQLSTLTTSAQAPTLELVLKLVQMLKALGENGLEPPAHAGPSHPSHPPIAEEEWDQVRYLANRLSRQSGGGSQDGEAWSKAQFPTSTWPPVLFGPSGSRRIDEKIIVREVVKALEDLITRSMSLSTFPSKVK